MESETKEVKTKYDFKNVAVRSRDHDTICEIAFRSKIKRYEVVHMLLEERHERESELRNRLQLTPEEFELVRKHIKEKARQIRAEAATQSLLRDRSR